MMIRAGAANREMTHALGVDVRLVHGFVFASGVALAASPLSSS
jgi:branched-chain amino acid transport system permease protein